MRRLGASLVLAVVLATFGVGWALDRVFDAVAPPDPDPTLRSMQAMAAGLARALERADDPQVLLDAWNASADAPHVSLAPLAQLPLPPELEQSFRAGQPLTLESAQGLTVHVALPSHAQALSVPLPQVADMPSASGLRLALTLLFYLGVTALVVVWLQPLLHRLARLRDTARALGEGRLSHRVDTTAMSQLGEIELEFNRMAQRIQTLVEDNRLLTSAVSHDLRTPLARLRFGIEALSECREPATRERYEQHLVRDLVAMESLVELLLSFARLDHELEGLAVERVEVASILGEAVNPAETTGPRLVFDRPPAACIVEGDARMLRMLVDNLVQNAVRYAHTQVLLSAEQDDAGITLSVEDDGPGIPADERTEILKPFVRGRDEPSGTGHGLGLAIVARIAGWHRASIEIDESRALGGARFRVRLPLPAI